MSPKNEWVIHDPESGEPIATHRRIDDDRGKRFTWEWHGQKRDMCEMPLYEVRPREADFTRCIVTEGERAAMHAARGITAYGTVGGARVQPCEKALQPLMQYETILLWPDNDSPGRGHMQGIGDTCHQLGHREIRVISCPDAKEKDDAADFDGDSEEFEKLLQEAKPFQPTLPDGLILRVVSEVPMERIRWLWPGVVPEGKLTLICGEPGLGKSQLGCYLAAKVTNGSDFSHGVGPCHQTGKVLMLACEDGIADTTRPRLEAAGADTRQVLTIEGVGKANRQKGFSLDVHLPLLDRSLSTNPDARLIVIDPISAYLGDTDSHNNADVRSLLMELAQLAEKHRVAVVAITHPNKAQGQSPMARVSGSGAFVAAVRSAWTMLADPDHPGRSLLLPLKSNLAKPEKGYRIHIEPQVLACGMETSRIVFDAEREDRTVNEVMGDTGVRGRKPDALLAAQEFLRDMLADGPVLANEIRRRAHEAGHSWPTVKRAKNSIADIATSKNEMEGPWYWNLAKTPSQPESESDQCPRAIS